MGTRARLVFAVLAGVLLTGAVALGIALILTPRTDTGSEWLALGAMGLVGLAIGLGASWIVSSRSAQPVASPAASPVESRSIAPLAKLPDAASPEGSVLDGAGPAPSALAAPGLAASAQAASAQVVEATEAMEEARDEGVPSLADARMEQCIRDALEHDRVTLAYQPVIDLTTGLLVGVEALLRLKDADGETIAPFEVIGVAERSGLIIDLGWRVLQLAALQGGAWRDDYNVVVPVAVNVSAVQLGSRDFPTDVLASVARAGIPAHGLTLELTESVMLGGTSPGSAQLHQLRAAGFELAIDDFGTGYASLSYLHELPASTLKIDQTFVSGVPDDRRAVAIVAGVVALARHCGIACIAEGIETEEQRAHLARLGVLGQGYLLGRPGPAHAIGTIIEQGRADLVPFNPPSGESADPTPARDPVTGALWRDPGMRELDREVVRARRSENSLVLAFVRVEVDVSVDQRSAHLVLVEVAVALQEALRPYDLVVRYGRDELVCAVVGTPLPALEERLNAVVEDMRLLPDAPTVLLGLAEMQPGESLEALVSRVDVGSTPRSSADTDARR
ncbi:MAG: diguanylate cyclase [Nocardioides sp.]|jgi:EAL domain-containing protein (putative c-di-GMP-specific phosphodiesterase class I)/GGDEF domain-containing protein|uniref:EAL domain-containing protein n=1 Tax=Nocardioides sp. TaxID=35761 RepID=UPI00260FE1E0|nr:EAL domain-containing protein [Nocardioides sp.]MCW2832141.1 diguanylate cyclase [Nocardioides sp.]